MSFIFENLEVYKKSLLFVEHVDNLIGGVPDRVHRIIFDQISRAALSIPLNIAEGNGRWHVADKRQFFWIARGSVFECVPLLEIMRSRGIITDKEANQSRERLIEIGKTLHGLIQSTEQSERDRKDGAN